MTIVFICSYRQAMKRLSTFYKDRPMSSRQTAFWWTEFVLRHDNINEILRPPSVQQTWWVKRQIDVWLVAALLIVLVVTLPLFVLMKIIKMIVSRMSKPDKIQTKLKVN